MPTIKITGQSGETKLIEVTAGTTLMEAIRDNDFEEMLAMCGGCCSCATCHVYIDESFADKVSDITETESDLLDISEHRTSQSRLSCQITIDDSIDGLEVIIAPEE